MDPPGSELGEKVTAGKTSLPPSFSPSQTLGLESALIGQKSGAPEPSLPIVDGNPETKEVEASPRSHSSSGGS